MNQELSNLLARCILVFTAGYELIQLGRSPFEMVAVSVAIVLL